MSEICQIEGNDDECENYSLEDYGNKKVFIMINMALESQKSADILKCCTAEVWFDIGIKIATYPFCGPK